jgi:hypothetical protein
MNFLAAFVPVASQAASGSAITIPTALLGIMATIGVAIIAALLRLSSDLRGLRDTGAQTAEGVKQVREVVIGTGEKPGLVERVRRVEDTNVAATLARIEKSLVLLTGRQDEARAGLEQIRTEVHAHVRECEATKQIDQARWDLLTQQVGGLHQRLDVPRPTTARTRRTDEETSS